MTQGQVVRRLVKPAVFVGALGPLVVLLLDTAAGDLGANPVETVTHRTGFTALTLLMITLAVTPLRRMSGIGALATLRRPIGLFAFFYATLHFLTYAVDQTYLSGLGVSPAAIVEDVVERPYITVGLTAFVLLIPLAVTSTKRWIKRLGAKRWQRVHRLVYVAAILGVLHFLWLVKADLFQPLVFAAVLAVLLGARLVSRRPDGPRRHREPRPAPMPEGTSLSPRS
jgi:sulfoxide reductase heme-binding subunit YedZ